MIRLLLVLHLLGIITFNVFSVNRENFKNCEQSSFCSRQHAVKPQQYIYSLPLESLKISHYEISSLLKSPSSDYPLTFRLTYLSHSTFRVQIDEVRQGYRRYRTPVGASLKSEPKLYPIKVSVASDHVIVVGEDNTKATVTLSPFTVKFFVGDVVVSILNERQLLNFDNNTIPLVNGENIEPVKENESDQSSNTGTDSEPTSDNEANKGDDSAANTDGLEDKGAPDTHPENHHSWQESFKGHADSRLNGPMSVSVDIDFPGFTHLYGIPEHADSFQLKNTEAQHPYRLYNLDVFEYELYNPMTLYGSIPVLWAHNSNNTIGIFWMNPSETWVDIDVSSDEGSGFFSKLPRLFSHSSNERPAFTRWISESGIIDTFFMLGNTPSDVSKAYSYLTGATPLPPLFALAYHQCRWNYNDEADVISLDEGFDRHQIPVDVIWLDIEHTDGKRYFTWDKVKFPSPGDMVDKINTKGRKLVTVIDPHIKKDTGWDLFNQAEGQKYFVKSSSGSTYDGWCWPGSSAWPDFTNPEVRNWWANLFTTYEPVRIDTMFSWNDMGEPSVFNGPEITMHKDAIHHDGWEHRDVHNLYGLYVHQATWDGLLMRSKNTERPFVLTRAFFAGSQRTASVWTGDNTANWEHLRISIPMLLSLSITGITFCGADIGGFFGNPDAELLTRWYQAAAYQPFMRAHAHMDTKRREPWLSPETNMNIIRSAIEDRYRLLPYWYTLFAQSEVNGHPIMAPIWFHFPNLTQTFSMDSQYMVGESLVVAPVTEAGASSVQVYLPPGTWYYMSPAKAFRGDQTIYFPVTLETIPVFYRGGSIVPRRERIRRSSSLMLRDPYTLFVFLDSDQDDAHGYLYVDDFHSLSRAQAHHFQFNFRMDQENLDARLNITKIPIPGAASVSSGTETNSGLSMEIERIVFVGFRYELKRITLLQGGARHNLEFLQGPGSLFKDSQEYIGHGTAGVVVVRKPMISLIPGGWVVHLVASGKLTGEL